eukprot:4053103-Prymnesium_polylepis.2
MQVSNRAPTYRDTSRRLALHDTSSAALSLLDHRGAVSPRRRTRHAPEKVGRLASGAAMMGGKPEGREFLRRLVGPGPRQSTTHCRLRRADTFNEEKAAASASRNGRALRLQFAISCTKYCGGTWRRAKTWVFWSTSASTLRCSAASSISSLCTVRWSLTCIEPPVLQRSCTSMIAFCCIARRPWASATNEGRTVDDSPAAAFHTAQPKVASSYSHIHCAVTGASTSQTRARADFRKASTSRVWKIRRPRSGVMSCRAPTKKRYGPSPRRA